MSAIPEAEVEKKFCLVCGDKALGHNFNALSCESCKAFFRRNALKKKDKTCLFDGCCTITMSSRRVCQPCRFRKCLQVGMMPELIMTRSYRSATVRTANESDEHENEHEDVVLRKRRRHHSPPVTTSSDYNSNQLDPTNYQAPDQQIVHTVNYSPTTHSSYDAQVQDQVDAEQCLDDDSLIRVPVSIVRDLINQCHKLMMTETTVSRCTLDHATMKDLLMTDRPPLSCICRCICGAVAMPTSNKNFQCVATSTGPDEDENKYLEEYLPLVSYQSQNVRQLDKEYGEFCTRAFFHQPNQKWSGLPDLLFAYEILEEKRQKCELAPYAKSSQDWRLAMRRTYDTIGRITKFCRRLNAFRELSTHDQAELIKASFGPLMVIRMVVCYERTLDAWRFSDPRETPIGLNCYLQYTPPDILDMARKLCLSFPLQWSRNDNLMVTIFGIILFDADRANVFDKTAVRQQQRFYYGLLKQQLREMYAEQKVHKVYEAIMGYLETFRKFGKGTSDTIILELNSRSMEPLLIDFTGIAVPEKFY